MSNGFRIGSQHQRAAVTVAEERTFHYIADEELELMSAADELPMSQIFWAALGVFFGSLAAAGDALIRYFPTGQFAPIGLLAVAIVAGSLPVMIVSGIAWRRQHRRVQRLQQTIRARHKVPVQGIAELDYPA